MPEHGAEWTREMAAESPISADVQLPGRATPVHHSIRWQCLQFQSRIQHVDDLQRRRRNSAAHRLLAAVHVALEHGEDVDTVCVRDRLALGG